MGNGLFKRIMTMKKIVTYEIHGQVERNCFFRIGKALVRVEFTGGAMNSSGVYPAQFVTDNPLFQRAIENSDAFRKGEIKRGRVEVTASTGEGDSVVDSESSMKSIPEVTNIQQARNLLMSSPYDCQLSQLQNKSAVKAMAAEKNISFPNWL